MSNTSIDTYVRNALSQGRGREEIQNSLRASGWNDELINQSFDRITQASAAYIAPVETPESGLKQFLFVLSFGSLYLAVWGFIYAAFGTVDMMFGGQPTNPETFRWAIAWFVVAGVVFFVSNHYISKLGTENRSEYHLTGTRKTFTYFTVILATITLIGSAVRLIYDLTGGELVGPSIFKVIIVALASVALFAYFFGDVKTDISQNLNKQKQ